MTNSSTCARSPSSARSKLIRFCSRIGLLILLILVLSAMAGSASASDTVFKALGTPGHVTLMRHAIAPGFGDPPEFVLEDCRTQRNLSATGRAQAQRIGELLRKNGIQEARVFSSQWCRCLETARLLELGEVEPLPILNSFFQASHLGDPQTRQLREWLSSQDLSQPLLLVTHQVNITALTGVYPSSGELVVLRREKDNQLALIGTLETD